MRMEHMKRFQEARTEFQKNPNAEAALLLHRAAWRAYLDGTISDCDFKEAIEQVELFITPTSAVPS
jgi:hypothetical protein